MFNHVDLSSVPTETLEKELQLRKPKLDIKQRAIGKESYLSFYWIDEEFTILVDENAVKFYPSADTMKDLVEWVSAKLNEKATPEPIACRTITGGTPTSNNLVLHCVADPIDYLLVDRGSSCISFEVNGTQEPSVPIVLHKEEATQLRDFITLFLENVVDA